MRKTMLKIGAGAVGGVIGSWMIGKALALSQKLPPRFQPQQPTRHPGELIVEQGEKLIGRLRPKLHSGAVQGMHWAYGLIWPVGLAALSDALGLDSPGKTLAAGAILGAIVWAVGYAGWLPATGIAPPVHRVPLGKSATGLAAHLAYGAIASVPLAIARPRLA